MRGNPRLQSREESRPLCIFKEARQRPQNRNFQVVPCRLSRILSSFVFSTFRSVVILRPCWKGFQMFATPHLPLSAFNHGPQSVELRFTSHGAYTFPTNVVQISPHWGLSTKAYSRKPLPSGRGELTRNLRIHYQFRHSMEFLGTHKN